ncbi:MAG: S9 family peptidase [Burkholderiales bacterium]|nr:S9 family peptidase [Burkholderiales bacterium]
MTIFKTAGALLATLLLSSAAMGADAAPKPSVESFFSNPDVRSAALSPSGKYLAWVTKNQYGRYVLLTASTQELNKISRAAGYENADVMSIAWVNDERLYMSISDVHDAGGHFQGEEYAVNRDGSQLVQLTAATWKYKQEQTGTLIKNKTLPAEYDVVATLHDMSDDIIVSHATYNNIDYSLESTRLYRLNTKTDKLTDLIEGTLPAEMKSWVLGRDGKPRLAISQGKGRRAVYYRDPATGNWSQLGDFNDLGDEGFSPAFVSFDETLYVTAGQSNGLSALYKYSLADKAVAKEPLVAIDGYDFHGSPIFDYGTKKLVGIRYENDAWSTAWTDAHMRELQKKVDQFLPSTVNSIYCQNCVGAPALLVASVSDQQPKTYFLYNVDKGTMTRIGSTLPDIKPEQMGERSFDHYTARDGRSIPVVLTMPPGESKGSKPAVVLVHGGPNLRGGSWEWDAEAQFLATRGYVVIQPEFRGSLGFGFDHFHAGWKQWGLTMQDDLADAAQWAIKKGIADPKRIAIGGGSYGGYATLMGLARNPELFRTGFEFAGVTDIDLMFTSAENDFSEDLRHYDLRTLIGDPKKDAAQLRDNSPTTVASKITQPILIAHGVLDRRVPIKHSQEFRDAIRKTNHDVEWIEYADEGHGFRYEKDHIDFYKHVEAFLQKNLAAAN